MRRAIWVVVAGVFVGGLFFAPAGNASPRSRKNGGAIREKIQNRLQNPPSPSFLVTNLTRGKCALQRRFSFPQPYPKSSNYFLGALTEESRSIVLVAERFCLGLSAVAAVFSPVLAGRS